MSSSAQNSPRLDLLWFYEGDSHKVDDAPDSGNALEISHSTYYAETPSSSDALPEWLEQIATRDNIVVINGAVYLYLEDSSGWMPLLSAASMKFLVDATGGYAPVVFTFRIFSRCMYYSRCIVLIYLKI